MNRGQIRGNRGITPVWLVLCACLCGVALSSIAAAAPEASQAATQRARSWENYFGVAILPSGRAVVAGDKGVVMISDDQGKTWARRQLRQGVRYDDLYSVAFAADGASGWVVGDRGVIFHTTDSGVTWTEQKAPADTALMTVAAIDAQKACASGDHGNIVCTSDGGTTWSLHKVEGDIAIFDLIFTDANNGWAVGEFQTVLHSSDGGATWKVALGGDRMKASDPYFAIAFDSGHNGLVLGLSGAALQTSDAGATWKPTDLAVAHSSLYAIAAIPTRAGAYCMAGENGVAALLDGGQLSQVQSGTSNAISGLAFSNHYAMAVGLSGTLLMSDDSGQHWHSLNNTEQALQNQAQ
jgi:photosystem II stability/assembly factor-like uncharacterized protein